MLNDLIRQYIQDLKDLIFQIEMIDYWTREDKELYKKYVSKLKELEIINKILN